MRKTNPGYTSKEAGLAKLLMWLGGMTGPHWQRLGDSSLDSGLQLDRGICSALVLKEPAYFLEN